MGGPVIGFCGGRIDWSNGDQALPLGPSVVQQTLMPCGPEQCPIGELCPGYVNFPFLPSFYYCYCYYYCFFFFFSLSRTNISSYFSFIVHKHNYKRCEAPLGTAAIGLIYVDPEGTPLGEFEGTAANM
jgi:hypothetical protein